MKKELVSFNPVVKDIESLVELDDRELEQALGGYAVDDSTCATNDACEPNCRTNCPTLC